MTTSPPVAGPRVNGVPILPVGILILGGYLTWFGVHYWRSDVKWPSDPVKAVLTGKPLPDPANTSDATLGKNIGNLLTGPGGGGGGTLRTESFSTGPAGTYSHDQLQALWTSAGGNPAKANLAAAIAQAESSGNPNATSSNPDGGTNVGLWQLDTKGVGSGHTIDQLRNPTVNAQITVLGSNNGTRWTPWETYNTGAYKRYLA